MATVQNPATPKLRAGVQPLRAGQGSSFLWRKLHSLLGIVPIGAFFLEHLLSNFEALKGPIAYGAQVKFLNSLPLVRVLEWVFIFLPILYHGLYGLYIWFRGKSNVVYYPWAGNWMYVAQRWTGFIAFLYIGQHVLRQRFMGISLPENPGAAFAKVQHELASPFMLAVYVIAMIAICWHFAYGIWLFAAKWGITPGEVARKRFGYACAAFGVILLFVGLASIWAFISPKYQNTPDIVPAAVVQMHTPPVLSWPRPQFALVEEFNMSSNPRITSKEFQSYAGAANNAIVALSQAVANSSLDPELQQLVKIRASKINGCAFCTQLHLNESRHIGIAAPKLDLVAVWRESGIFSDREKAALAWTEHLTRLSEHHVTDEAEPAQV